MSDWSDTIAPTLISVFTALAKDPALESGEGDGFSATWKDRPPDAVSDDQTLALALKLVSFVGIGWDETRYEYVDPASTAPVDAPYLGQMRATQVGQRKFVLQLEALVPEQTDLQFAIAALERIRSGLSRDSISETLNEANVAVVDIQQAGDTSYSDNQRVVSRATMAVVMATCVNATDPAPTGWIAQIQVTSHISDVDGIELPIPPNVVDEPIPPTI